MSIPLVPIAGPKIGRFGTCVTGYRAIHRQAGDIPGAVDDHLRIARPAARRAAPGSALMLTQADTATTVAGTTSPAEVQTANIRAALEERLGELRAEHAELMAGLTT